jgi:hypothetical protein
MSFRLGCLALAAALGLSNLSFAAPIYSQDFNVDDTANWTVLPSTGANATDYIADFFYDYSAIGVPAAPSGTGTRGLKLSVNNTTGVFGGVTASPIGQSFSGNYVVTFDMWQNYVGPLGPGGSGTTQFSQYGIGTAGTTTQWIGASRDSLTFGTTLDGGSATDVRVYSPTAVYASGNAVYNGATSNNNSNVYYTSAYSSVSAPAAQVGLFPGQTGSTDPGETAFSWRKVKIEVAGGFATWSVDGTVLGKVDLSTVTLGGGNILFGMSDTNATSSTDANRAALNVTLIDNITVVPEPACSTLIAFGLAAIGLISRRRRGA